MYIVLKYDLTCFMVGVKGLNQRYCAYNSYGLCYGDNGFYRMNLSVISVSFILGVSR